MESTANEALKEYRQQVLAKKEKEKKKAEAEQKKHKKAEEAKKKKPEVKTTGILKSQRKQQERKA